MPNESSPSIAVIIPCYNEGLTISKVVRNFREQLPDANIFVFDNNSQDNTAIEARQAGATVIKEKRQGKGFVVAAMLLKISADFFVMVDGDDTYPAEYVHKLLQPLYDETADMVVGQRLSDYDQQAFRPFHLFGNRLVCGLINSIFNTQLSDPMSGYRAFTRDVADNLPTVAFGFDIETEMTLQLLYRRYIIKEIIVPYRARPEGSASKLNTIRDGIRVLVKILGIFRAYKPLTLFGSLAILSLLVGVALGISAVLPGNEGPLLLDNITQLVLSGFFSLSAVILASVGLILNTFNYRIAEIMSILTKQIGKSSVESPYSQPDTSAVESVRIDQD